MSAMNEQLKCEVCDDTNATIHCQVRNEASQETGAPKRDSVRLGEGGRREEEREENREEREGGREGWMDGGRRNPGETEISSFTSQCGREPRSGLEYYGSELRKESEKRKKGTGKRKTFDESCEENLDKRF
eukprot:746306-Hanusia_phi.AAC.3